LHLEDEHGAFHLKGKRSTLECFYTPSDEEDSSEEETPKKPFLFLCRGQSVAFDVTFKPTLAQYLEGRIRLLLGDTYSDKIEIELVGEGHCDRVSLDGLEEDEKERTAESSLKKDVIDAVRVNHLEFGLCPVGKYCRQTFTMTSHYTTKVMRFEWETDAPFEISPRMGHLRPGCAKVITVTLKSDVPAIFRRHLAKCKVDRIKYELPKRKVPDWDDGMQIVTWVDTTRKEPEATWPEKDKVVEIAPEPVHEMLEGNSQEDEVYFSAHVDYVKLKVDLRVVQFKDTIPYQTRTANFSIHNIGTVPLEYHWEQDMDEATVKRVKPYSRPPMR
ncbi:HYDIN protein, partial [Grantiella picta]|nr:HYDIN protein [Grantiella picta]